MAEFLPHHPVLREGLQVGRGLSQVNNVTGVRQVEEDLDLHVQRQVIEGHPAARLLM